MDKNVIFIKKGKKEIFISQENVCDLKKKYFLEIKIYKKE